MPWTQILVLYDILLHLAPSPITRLHHAVAVRYTKGAESALAELEGLGDVLERYGLFHATRAELLRDLGRPSVGGQLQCSFSARQGSCPAGATGAAVALELI
ncbi:hypothetical protein [Nonomuraea maritima]|uniref:hypothetical protein n=1 Tax=Nonomuraea maritima TaxID=683260 RepID=UPI0037236D93